MASKLARLKREALESAMFHGHSMYPFATIVPNVVARSHCQNCGKYVQVDTQPAPNGIEIGGEAVALGCAD